MLRGTLNTIAFNYVLNLFGSVHNCNTMFITFQHVVHEFAGKAWVVFDAVFGCANCILELRQVAKQLVNRSVAGGLSSSAEMRDDQLAGMHFDIIHVSASGETETVLKKFSNGLSHLLGGGMGVLLLYRGIHFFY